ncbi:TIGR03620 family F420-dependent LLM class oxidoreductase [Nocardia sp. NPDC057227]|uniref:TIGR03620 family F420-dependent LLM class oxidoreductase n=1 Tax=Nocardia sp. NPDC057227 TaxID=3346056 RepID=UPI003624FE9F
MGIELGLFGAHLRAHEVDGAGAARLERAGFGTLWLDASPPADLAYAERLLAATTRLTVGTSVVNVWSADPVTVAASYHRIAGRYPDRFLLGIGIGHREVDTGYASPYDTLAAYLDTLREAGVPQQRIVLAALGPRMLRLARERAGGTVPCLVTPEHTRRARAIVGPDRLLLPGHFALPEPDPAAARTLARSGPPGTAIAVTNYAANLRRLGYTDADLAGTGSDRLIDALALHGTAPEVVTALTAHLDAGADHVGIYPLGPDPIGTLCLLAAEAGTHR